MVYKIFVFIFWVIQEKVTQENTSTGMENPDVGGDVSNTGGRTVVEEAYQKTAGNMELQVQEGTEINDVDYHVPLLHPPAGTTDMINWI